MAGENYRRVVPSFWTDPDVKRRLTLEQKALLLYYFTSPHSNMIGLYYCPIDYASSETGLTTAAIGEAIAGVLSPFLTYDEATEEIFVHAAARHQVGEELKGPDHRKRGICRLLEGVHSAHLKRAFLEKYVGWELGVPLPEGREGPSKPLPSPLRGATQAIAVAGAVAGTGTDVVAGATNGATAKPRPKPGRHTAPSRAPPGLPNWVDQAVEIYAAQIGIVAHGKAGKLLKPVVDRCGWAEVKRSLECFCELAPYEDFLTRMEAGTLRPGEEKVKKFGYHTSLAAFVERYTHWAQQATT